MPADNNYQQLFTGISLPIGRGLFTDDRRAAMKQAKLFTQMAEAEQIKLINKILLDAAKDYWQWYFSYYNYRLMNQNAAIAQEIFQRVKLNESLGEASVIDPSRNSAGDETISAPFQVADGPLLKVETPVSTMF